MQLHDFKKLALPAVLLACMAQAQAATLPPTPASLLSEALGDVQVQGERSATVINGYQVKSGMLVGAQGTVGALVTITGPDGAITAFIDRDDQHGILQIDASGNQTFSPDAKLDFPSDDAIEAQLPALSGDLPVAPGNITYIDALVGFTARALATRPVDPVAFALGQMEWVNLSLRNSKVYNIELRLAGVRVTDQDIPVTGGGLSTWQRQLTAQRANYLHDINVGFSVGGDAGGWASLPGYSSVNSIEGTSPFKHEMGHNVGGAHCYPAAGDNYMHGHNAGGGFTTNLCGNSRPYYSTPDVTVDGRVIGDARTADMARLWREQAGRLSGYSPAFVGERMIYTSYQEDIKLYFPFKDRRSRGGVVALSADVGPTALTYGGEGITSLAVKLAGPEGVEREVKLRAQRQLNGCDEVTTMNSYVRCHPDVAGGSMTLTLSYHVEDNLELAPGWYSGAVQLKALEVDDQDWSLPILVSLALKR